MDEQQKAAALVQEMLRNDPFSQWLGVEVLDAKPGTVTLQMTVRHDMLNGFHTCHGGITFAFADSALAFAANNHGNLSVALENNMSYFKAVYAGDILRAVAVEENCTRRTAVYRIEILRSDGDKVGLFSGTVYRTGKNYTPPDGATE